MTATALHAVDPIKAHPVSALALVETVTAVEVFTENGLDPILERIEKEVRSLALDISTPKGRKEIASLARKIANSKTAIEELGKNLVTPLKEQAKKIDLERSRAWDRLEALQKEIRQPLTDWENSEKDRVAKHEAKLAEIILTGSHTAANWQTMPVEEMNDRLKQLLSDKTDWQEFSQRAKLALEAATDAIAAAILKRQKHDAEMAELVRLRKEEEERKQREYDEHIAKTAAEQARLLAEEEARKAAEAEAARVAAEKAKAEQERLRIQREKEEAEARGGRRRRTGSPPRRKPKKTPGLRRRRPSAIKRQPRKQPRNASATGLRRRRRRRRQPKPSARPTRSTVKRSRMRCVWLSRQN